MVKTFLMCPPDKFEVSYVINPWMQDYVGKISKEVAVRQWNGLAEKLSKIANISLIPQIEGFPDMVFTANAGSVFKNKEFVLSNFKFNERKGEEFFFHKWFENNGYEVKEMPSFIEFEGDGDCLRSKDGVVWLGTGFRTSKDSLDHIFELSGKVFHVEKLELVNPNFYHLDTCFCPLSGGEVIYFPEAFSASSNLKIKHRFGKKLIEVEAIDANNFACNAINVCGDLILNKASEGLKRTLKKLNYNVIETDLTEFMKSGGSSKCLVLEL